MVAFCIENLNQIKRLVQSLSDRDFQKQSENLFHSTIGEHVRHILEFYSCLINGIEKGEVNYDLRQRQKNLETQTNLVYTTIENIVHKLELITEDKSLVLQANYSLEARAKVTVTTSVYRELGYCLEHSIHHQALIKSALKEFDFLQLVEYDFGIASSTLRNRKACAQ